MELMWMSEWALMLWTSPHSRHVLLVSLENPWTSWPKTDRTDVFEGEDCNDSAHSSTCPPTKQSYSKSNTLTNLSHRVAPETMKIQNHCNSDWEGMSSLKKKPIMMNWPPFLFADKTFPSHFEAFSFHTVGLILATQDGSIIVCCIWCVNQTFQVWGKSQRRDANVVRVSLFYKSHNK